MNNKLFLPIMSTVFLELHFMTKCSVNLKSLTELGQTTKVSISDLGCSPVKRCNEFPKK